MYHRDKKNIIWLPKLPTIVIGRVGRNKKEQGDQMYKFMKC
jgi:hypothetical protein